MKEQYRAVGSYGTLGIEIVLSVLLGSYAGYWLDQKFNTAPVLLALGFFFGLGAAGKAIHRTWKEMQKATAREEREQGNPAPQFESKTDRPDPVEGSPTEEHPPISRRDHHGRS